MWVSHEFSSGAGDGDRFTEYLIEVIYQILKVAGKKQVLITVKTA